MVMGIVPAASSETPPGWAQLSLDFIALPHFRQQVGADFCNFRFGSSGSLLLCYSGKKGENQTELQCFPGFVKLRRVPVRWMCASQRWFTSQKDA
jgi:hypothetical protein